MRGAWTTKTSESAAPIPTLTLSRCKLIVLSGREKGQEYLIDKELIRVGSSNDNELRLADDTISRRHAQILLSNQGYLIRDSDSTNGIFLDGVRVREAFLRPGCTITLGDISLRFQTETQEIQVLPSDKQSFGEVMGAHVKMREMFSILERVAPTDSTVLLQGETGTGKELVARALHDNSRRKQRPFVVFDCGAVAPNLIESELFGHERGAFTGASAARVGAFEQANGGTLFMDEIGELDPALQPKLLRVLEQRELKPVGGSAVKRVDVRIVAATHRDLAAEVRARRFREDLFFRLSVVLIGLPPLRERKEDIFLIAHHMLQQLNTKVRGNKPLQGLSMGALEILHAHDWPGNIRELRNVLERAAAFAEGPFLEARDLLALTHEPDEAAPSLAGKTLEAIEREAIIQTLELSGGNKTQAARTLGIAYSTLYEKMKKYGLS